MQSLNIPNMVAREGPCPWVTAIHMFGRRSKSGAPRRAASRAAILLIGFSLWLGLAGCTTGATAYGFVASPSFDTPAPVTAGPSPTLSLVPGAGSAVPGLDESPTATLGVLPTSGPTITPPATVPATF